VSSTGLESKQGRSSDNFSDLYSKSRITTISQIFLILLGIHILMGRQDSVVGIATGYGLDYRGLGV
jgi:hypothetical protein